MPAGTYRVFDGEGKQIGLERFRCAPGPAGWRYFSTISFDVPEPHTEQVDVAVNAAWEPVRVRIETGPHSLVLIARGDRMAGVRDGLPVDLEWSRETHVDYLSPAFNAITARRLAATAEIDVLYLLPHTAEPTRSRQRYELLGEEEVATPVGRFRARAWRYTALESEWTALLWTTGDIVVRYDRVFELVEYEPLSTGPVALPANQ